MYDDAEFYGPQLPAARRQLFRDDVRDDDEDDEFLFDDEILAEILEDDVDDVDFGYDDEYSGESSSIDVLSDSGSSIEALEDYSAFADEGITDDDIMYSPYQILPPQAAAEWNLHNAYYSPVSPMNPPYLPTSSECWSASDLYSPMSSPASHWGMAGDGPYSPDFFSMDGSHSDFRPTYWNVSGSTYKTAEDANYSSSRTNSSFYSATDFSSDDCY